MPGTDTAIESTIEDTADVLVIEAASPEANPVEAATAVEAKPQSKPRTKVKAARAPVTPAIESTRIALERIHGSGSSQAIAAMQQNIEILDRHLRDTRRPDSTRLMNEPKWLRSTGKMVRARAGAAFRLQWLEARRLGQDVPPFVEPTERDLVLQFVEAARFSTITRLGMFQPGDWGIGPCPGVAALQSQLNMARWKATTTIDQALGGRINQIAFSGWAITEAKAAIHLKREANLVARVRRINDLIHPLALECSARVRKCCEDFGRDALGHALLQFREPDHGKPRTTNSQIQAAEKALLDLETGILGTMPPGPERDQVIASIRVSHQVKIDQELAILRSMWETYAGPRIAELGQWAAYMATRPEGWRELGETADKVPSVFPPGFASRWLGVIAEVLIESDHKTILDVIDAA